MPSTPNMGSAISCQRPPWTQLHRQPDSSMNGAQDTGGNPGDSSSFLCDLCLQLLPSGVLYCRDPVGVLGTRAGNLGTSGAWGSWQALVRRQKQSQPHCPRAFEQIFFFFFFSFLTVVSFS